MGSNRVSHLIVLDCSLHWKDDHLRKGDWESESEAAQDNSGGAYDKSGADRDFAGNDLTLGHTNSGMLGLRMSTPRSF